MYIKGVLSPPFSAISCPFLLTSSHFQLIPPVLWRCAWILILFCDPINFMTANWLLHSFCLHFWNSLQAVQRCYKCLIRAVPSSVTHFQHLGQLWVSTLLPSTGQRGFSDWGCNKLLHVTTFCCTVLNQTSERWGDNPLVMHTIMKQQKMSSSSAYPKGW